MPRSMEVLDGGLAEQVNASWTEFSRVVKNAADKMEDDVVIRASMGTMQRLFVDMLTLIAEDEIDRAAKGDDG